MYIEPSNIESVNEEGSIGIEEGSKEGSITAKPVVDGRVRLLSLKENVVVKPQHAWFQRCSRRKQQWNLRILNYLSRLNFVFLERKGETK
mmetsp:Transcript_13351/g.15309  ORF Transcript_13351/g.15309 Transcript_13351/m.15309 type:complete len:90 (-) Transcript_13351:40-309(-)